MDSKELYKKAYNLHYSKSDFSKAIELYQEIIKDFPESEEAGYSKNQIENIENMSNLEKEKLKNKKEKQEGEGKTHLSMMDRQEAILEAIMKDISKMGRDIHTISTIVLIWFILGLIGMLISVITFLSIA